MTQNNLPATVSPYDMAFHGPPMNRDKPRLYDAAASEGGARVLLGETRHLGDALGSEAWIGASKHDLVEVEQ